MDFEKTQGIVLRVIPWSETSCIATLFTRDFGRIAVVAKGARRPKSPFEVALDLLALCDFGFIQKSSEQLDILTDAKLIERFYVTSRTLRNLYASYYLAEFMLASTEIHQNVDSLFELLKQTIQRLNPRNHNPNCAANGIEKTDQDRFTEGSSTLIRDRRRSASMGIAEAAQVREQKLTYHASAATLSDSSRVQAHVLRFEIHALQMLGHQPRFVDCAACGDTLHEQRSIAFGLLAGGALCPRCRSGQRQIVTLSSASAAILEEIRRMDWRSDKQVAIPAKAAGEMRGLMNRYIATLLDKRLRLVEQW